MYDKQQDTMHQPPSTFFSCFIQYQAGQAEKQIKAEFERLHEVLIKEEALCLKALASDEEARLAVLDRYINNSKENIADLKKLIDNLKKEMGNEDVLFLRVSKGSSASPCFRSV